MANNEASKKINIEIPQKLLDLIKADDTALEIARICFENDIKEDAKIRGISFQTGRVLFGDLPPKEFQKTLEDRIEISPFLALKIAREINESLFYPVKEGLAVLYGNGAVVFQELPINYPEAAEEEIEGKSKERKDAYRESVE